MVVGGADRDRRAGLGGAMMRRADRGARLQGGDRAEQVAEEVEGVAAQHLDEAGPLGDIVGVGRPRGHVDRVALGPNAVERRGVDLAEAAGGDELPRADDGRREPRLQSHHGAHARRGGLGVQRLCLGRRRSQRPLAVDGRARDGGHVSPRGPSAVGVCTDDAARAGVGLGTLYRRIPSLERLISAILIDAIDEMTRLAELALEDPDPWHALVTFAESYVQLRTASCGLHAALAADDEPDPRGPTRRLRAPVRRLVEHAQEAGAVRSDLDWRDVPFALASAVPADHTIGLTAWRDQWRHTLAIILEGLAAAPVRTSARSASVTPRCVYLSTRWDSHITAW
jgi:AcrR family transcriptional regulator